MVPPMKFFWLRPWIYLDLSMVPLQIPFFNTGLLYLNLANNIDNFVEITHYEDFNLKTILTILNPYGYCHRHPVSTTQNVKSIITKTSTPAREYVQSFKMS